MRFIDWEMGKTWIDMMLDPAMRGLVHGWREGKHWEGSKPSPHAAQRRRQANKRQRDARRDHYRRAK